MWANLSATAGLEEAYPIRDSFVEYLTPAQIAEGQKLARKCLANNYKGC
jgi:hypothetical protein